MFKGGTVCALTLLAAVACGGGNGSSGGGDGDGDMTGDGDGDMTGDGDGDMTGDGDGDTTGSAELAQGMAIVSGGQTMSSSNFQLILTTGESPGGHARSSSETYQLRSGVVDATSE